MDEAQKRILDAEKARYERPFEPATGSPDRAPPPERQVAHALDYIAAQLWAIRQALEQQRKP